MNRRRFALAAAASAVALLIPSGINRGNDAVARKRRRRDGGTAVARAAVTGIGGSVSVSVKCVPGHSASATDDSQAAVRC